MDTNLFTILAYITTLLVGLVYLFEYMFDKSIKKPFRIALVIILAVSITFLVFIFFKNNASNSSPKNTESDKKDSINKEQPINSESENKPDSINSGSNKKTQTTYDSLSAIKHNANSGEIFNSSENAKFAVLAITNGKKDNQLATIFVEWLKNYGTASQSILLNAFIEKGYFNQILDANPSIITTTNVKQSAKFICLVRSKINYTNSKVSDGLIVAQSFYEVKIIETNSGKSIATFDQEFGPSEISEKKAKQKAESILFDYLVKTNFAL